MAQRPGFCSYLPGKAPLIWHHLRSCSTHHSILHVSYALPLSTCSKQVAFPPRLKMKRAWLASDSGERNVEYELVSTVVHHGKTISSGHYTADVRQPDDR